MPLDNLPGVYCTVEGSFPLRGTELPALHGAGLYSALCALPGVGSWLAEADDIAIAPVTGRTGPDGRLTLTAESRLLVRLPAAELPRVLGLAGQRLDVDGQGLEIGEPRVDVPRPAAALRANLVVLDRPQVPAVDTTAGVDGPAGSTAAEAFVAEIRRQLAALEIESHITLGSPGTLQLPERSVSGFALSITGLAPDDSIHLQEAGLGDHRKLGCGVFVPG